MLYLKVLLESSLFKSQTGVATGQRASLHIKVYIYKSVNYIIIVLHSKILFVQISDVCCDWTAGQLATSRPIPRVGFNAAVPRKPRREREGRIQIIGLGSERECSQKKPTILDSLSMQKKIVLILASL